MLSSTWCAPRCKKIDKITLLSAATLTFLLMLSDDNFIFLLNKLVVEKFGISLLSKALGGLLGSFPNTINKRKKRQIKANKTKGANLIVCFIF